MKLGPAFVHVFVWATKRFSKNVFLQMLHLLRSLSQRPIASGQASRLSQMQLALKISSDSMAEGSCKV